jgi:hypothetical protein
MAATRGGKMKIGDMTTEEIKKEMRVLNERSVKEYTWLHKNPRWMGLLNEYERRVMAKHIGGAKCGKGWHGQRIRHKLAALKRGHKFGGYKIDVPIKLGKSYRYDDEFEGKRLVDIVKVIETPIEIESKVIVYSPTLRANILLDKGKLKRR